MWAWAGLASQALRFSKRRLHIRHRNKSVFARGFVITYYTIQYRGGEDRSPWNFLTPGLPKNLLDRCGNTYGDRKRPGNPLKISSDL